MRLVRAQREEQIEKRGGGVLVHFANIFGFVRRHGIKVWLYCFKEVRVETCDEIVVVFLLGRLLESIPGQVVDVPGVHEIDVGESQCHSSLRFGQRRDKEV